MNEREFLGIVGGTAVWPVTVRGQKTLIDPRFRTTVNRNLLGQSNPVRVKNRDFTASRC
jgi:hypothetical protein